MLLLLISIE